MMKPTRGKSHRGSIKPGFRRVSELQRHGIPHAFVPRDNVNPPKDDKVVDSVKPGSGGSLSTGNMNSDVGLSSSLEYMNVTTTEADAGTFGSMRNWNSSSVCADRDRNTDDQSLASALWDQLVIDSETKASFQPFSSPGGWLVEANPHVGDYQQHWLHSGASPGCYFNPLDECVPPGPQIQISQDVQMCPVYQVMPLPVGAFQHLFYIGFPPYNHHGFELNPAYHWQFRGDEYPADSVIAAQLAHSNHISEDAADPEGQLWDFSSDVCDRTAAETKPISSVGEPNESKGTEINHHGSRNPPPPVYSKQPCDKGSRPAEERLGRQSARVSTSPISSSGRPITSLTPANGSHCTRNPALLKDKFASRKNALGFFDSSPVRGKFRPFGQRNMVHRSAPVTSTSFNNPRVF